MFTFDFIEKKLILFCAFKNLDERDRMREMNK